MLTFKTRAVKRDLWLLLYRRYRIARREAMKATIDAMLYGFGFTRVTADGTIEYLPFHEVYRA
jgi:hypothetical protein